MASFIAGGIAEQINIVSSSGGTTTLTVTSKQVQVLTGSANQTYVLPDATTMFTGQKFEFYNQSSGILTIENHDTTVLSTVSPNTALVIKLQSNGTSNGSWAKLTTASSGGSGSSKNYLSAYTASTSGGVANVGNGNFELGSTSGWSLAHSSLSGVTPTSVASAGSAFSSSSGGSAASGNLSLSVVSSSQLAGSYSGSLASSASSVAGDLLISNAFYIDAEDEAKMQTVSFYYSVNSGASNLNFSGTSSNSFALWLYDVTNAAWIQPSGVYNLVQNSGVGRCVATFQTTSNSIQYQLALVNINASTGAYTLYLDDFLLGPQTAPQGPAVGDWNAYTPTVSTGSWTNLNGWWRRVGDSMEVVIKTGPVTADGSGNYYWSLPSGYSIDLSGLKGSSTTPSIAAGDGGIFTLGDPIGIATIRQEGSAGYFDGTSGSTWPDPRVYAASSTTVAVIAGSATQQTRGFAAGSAMSLITNVGNNCYIGMRFIVPIAGWSSNVEMSNDTDTRVIGAEVALTTSQSMSLNTPIKYDTVLKDLAGMYNTSTGLFTVPVAGNYIINATTQGTALSGNFILQINGTSKNYIGSVTTNITAGSTSIYGLKAGDTIAIAYDSGSANTATGSQASGYANKASVFRLSGPAVVAATEVVAAKYYVSASETISANVQVNFDTKVFDTHNAVTTTTAGTSGTWKFTAPVSGYYQVEAAIINSSQCSVKLYKNGSADTYISYVVAGQLGTGSTLIQLNAGDYIDVRPDASGTISIATPTACHISIFRLKN